MTKTEMIMPANCVALNEKEAKAVYGGKVDMDIVMSIYNYAFVNGCYAAGKYARQFYPNSIPTEDLGVITTMLMQFSPDALSLFVQGYNSPRF